MDAEVRRHNSEDDIDHGPVLQSLRKTRELELSQENEAKRMLKEEKRKEKS